MGCVFASRSSGSLQFAVPACEQINFLFHWGMAHCSSLRILFLLRELHLAVYKMVGPLGHEALIPLSLSSFIFLTKTVLCSPVLSCLMMVDLVSFLILACRDFLVFSFSLALAFLPRKPKRAAQNIHLLVFLSEPCAQPFQGSLPVVGQCMSPLA